MRILRVTALLDKDFWSNTGIILAQFKPLFY